ncbi:Hypothetical protein FKW44_007950, partial [Caligus rogercresseyi]
MSEDVNTLETDSHASPIVEDPYPLRTTEDKDGTFPPHEDHQEKVDEQAISSVTK